MTHPLHSPQVGLNEAKDGVADKSHAGEPEEAAFKPLSRVEVAALKEKLGAVSLDVFLLRVLIWQAAAGFLIAALAWLLSASALVGYSALYGAMCAVVPSALVAKMVRRWATMRVLTHAGGMLASLFLLELVKVVVTICLLLAAPLVLKPVSWLALVVGFVLVLKVYWVVALMGLGQTRRVQKIGINE